jgi:hypothetical protein
MFSCLLDNDLDEQRGVEVHALSNPDWLDGRLHILSVDCHLSCLLRTLVTKRASTVIMVKYLRSKR